MFVIQDKTLEKKLLIVETLTEIVSNLNWRHQTIGNIIKWKQFESGA